MNLFLEYSVRDPVFMLYPIQLIFKTLFHPCEEGIQCMLGYVIKAPLLAPRKETERQGSGGTLNTLPWLLPVPSQEQSAHQRPIYSSPGEQKDPKAGRNPN